jgi:hypothetical protein
MLEERKFWPIPVGKPAQQWIEEVRDSSLSTSDQIELLQNEAIFRSTSLDLDAAQIRAAIRSLGGKALRSLDIQANDLSPCGLVQEFVFRLTDQCLSELAVRCCGRRR